jgi:hypothetical protein
MLIWRFRSSRCQSCQLLQILRDDVVILLLRLMRLFEELCFRRGRIPSLERQMLVKVLQLSWRYFGLVMAVELNCSTFTSI